MPVSVLLRLVRSVIATRSRIGSVSCRFREACGSLYNRYFQRVGSGEFLFRFVQEISLLGLDDRIATKTLCFGVLETQEFDVRAAGGACARASLPNSSISAAGDQTA